jgi:hypothetical protein
MEYIHELYSFRKLLVELFPTIPIFDERDRGYFVRPSFRLEEAAHYAEMTGGRFSGWLDHRTTQIVYFGPSLGDVTTKENIINERLMRDKVVQGWLENFVYPASFMKVVDVPSSTISNKTIYVVVTGIREGQETLGLETSIAVPAGNKGVLIRVNRYPLSYPWFSAYNVYVSDQQGVTKLHSQVLQPTGKQWVSLIVSGVGTGVAAPTTSEVKFRNIMVGDISMSHREDEIVEGVWNTFINVNTQSLGFLFPDQFVDTIEEVNQIQEVQ